MKKHIEKFKPVFLRWLPLGVSVTVVVLISFCLVGQTIRLLANDPQVQIAEDLTTIMNAGQKVENIFPPTYVVDISRSLAPFVVMYDDAGVPVAGSARLDGALPTIHDGVLDKARGKSQSRVTWEPKPGLRSAIVINSYTSGETSGFILVGRSLRESEGQQIKILYVALIGWLVGLVLTFLARAYVDQKKTI